MKPTETAMKDTGLRGNLKKCSVLHVKRGVQQEDNDSIKLDESFVIQSLKQQSRYKFLGVLENIKQEDLLALECASKEYLKRLSVIWSSPLSDVNKVTASNQYALPVLSCLMPTHRWPMSELQRIDREVSNNREWRKTPSRIVCLVIYTKSSWRKRDEIYWDSV